MNDETIECNVCKEMVKDDNEFICSQCVAKWRGKIYEQGKKEVLNDFLKWYNKHFEFNDGSVEDKITQLKKESAEE